MAVPVEKPSNPIHSLLKALKIGKLFGLHLGCSELLRLLARALRLVV
jgi:hypothetical protein